MNGQQIFNSNEVLVQGVAASPGIVMGNACIHQAKRPVIPTGRIDKEMVSEELTLFREACEKLRQRWRSIKEREADKKSSTILATQIDILSDPELIAQIELYIKQDYYRAQQAINKTFERYIKRFSNSGSEVMDERAIDLADMRDRLIEATVTDISTLVANEGDILVAEEFSPREIIQLSHQKVKGFVMERGGNTSHAAIIARSIGIPAVVGAKGILENLADEDMIYLDGEKGTVSVNPSEETSLQIEQFMANRLKVREEEVKICCQSSTTTDRVPFVIRANIEFAEELANVEQYRAKGIGLLRTESVYLNHHDFGGLKEQETFYEHMLAQTGDEPVIIRLFDIGGDKILDSEITENNPFLGWRGIRMLLDKRTLLHDQLSALLAVAGQYPGRVKILVPMVSRLEEVKEVKKEIEACQQELTKAGRPVDHQIALGIMVEIPSVAIQAAHFASEVDFFSIGSNDLTQYLLAVDRGNAFISGLYNQRHPAVWKMIERTITAADDNGIEVDVCGEIASDPVAAACLLGLGIRTLSMSPISISAVKKVLVSRSLGDMKDLAARTLQCGTLQEVETVFENWKDNQ